MQTKLYKSYKSKIFLIFIICRLREIIVAPSLKIFPPPLTFSPKSGFGQNNISRSLIRNYIILKPRAYKTEKIYM